MNNTDIIIGRTVSAILELILEDIDNSKNDIYIRSIKSASTANPIISHSCEKTVKVGKKIFNILLPAVYISLDQYENQMISNHKNCSELGKFYSNIDNIPSFVNKHRITINNNGAILIAGYNFIKNMPWPYTINTYINKTSFKNVLRHELTHYVQHLYYIADTLDKEQYSYALHMFDLIDDLNNKPAQIDNNNDDNSLESYLRRHHEIEARIHENFINFICLPIPFTDLSFAAKNMLDQWIDTKHVFSEELRLAVYKRILTLLNACKKAKLFDKVYDKNIDAMKRNVILLRKTKPDSYIWSLINMKMKNAE